MVRYIDEYRERFGVEPICAVLPIAPATYFRHKGHETDPARRSARARRDDELRVEIQRIWDDKHQEYGPRKVWRQLRRDGIKAARCTVGRLMHAMGARRRGARPRVAHDDATGSGRGPAARSSGSAVHGDRSQSALGLGLHVRRDWRGFVYTAFVIDVFARRIVGWRVSSSLRTDFVLDALEQAISARCGHAPDALIHHSDRGTQYVSMRYTERLADEGIAPSVGSRGIPTTSPSLNR
jgi:putative transposase